MIKAKTTKDNPAKTTDDWHALARLRQGFLGLGRNV
jgi:hypothetical protein